MAGWRRRVVPTLGHLAVRMITNGAVDRAVHGWIADECSRSTVKNSLAVLVRVLEQAVRDGVIDRNPARVTGWQHEFRKAEDELDDPRALALPDWADPAHSSLTPSWPAQPATSAAGATSSSSPPAPAHGSARSPAAASATSTPTTGSGPSAGRPHRHPADSPTRAPRANAPATSRSSSRSATWSNAASTALNERPDARLFTGPRGGRITHRSPARRDTLGRGRRGARLRAPAPARACGTPGLTWMADAGVPVHVLREDRRARLDHHHPALPAPGPARHPVCRRRHSAPTYERRGPQMVPNADARRPRSRSRRSSTKAR